MSRWWELNSRPHPYQGCALPLSYTGSVGAENEVRTRDPQLGRLMLYQLSYFRKNWWAEEDSNLRSDYAADLQSAPVGHFGICPEIFQTTRKEPEFEPMEGVEPTTPRLQITCSSQLSYIGDVFHTNFPQKGLQR